MNCPGACLVFGAERHSYRDLPLRLAEFGDVYRYEREGVLHGLLRVRVVHPGRRARLLHARPDRRRGRLDLRDDRRALRPLRLRAGPGRALHPAGEVDRQPTSSGSAPRRRSRTRSSGQGRDYQLNPGDGAFYGPKIDFHVTDALGRSWQLGTCQLDFQMPERFELAYQGEDNAEHTAGDDPSRLLGSMERFAGILIEHHGGRFPAWLAPVQATVLPVSDPHLGYASRLAARAGRGRRPGPRRRAHRVGRAQDPRRRARQDPVHAGGRRARAGGRDRLGPRS